MAHQQDDRGTISLLLDDMPCGAPRPIATRIAFDAIELTAGRHWLGLHGGGPATAATATTNIRLALIELCRIP